MAYKDSLSEQKEQPVEQGSTHIAMKGEGQREEWWEF